MRLIEYSADPHAYLASCAVIDSDHPAVIAQARALAAGCDDQLSLIRRSFEFVRDQIAHSWDVQRGPLTCRASEVLQSGVGYCYGKSHLLAALLRAQGVACALCYQRLAVGERGAPYCLHGLNAVRLPDGQWFRIDARGNKPGVDAQFTPPQERLAFVLQDSEERDFPQLFARPLPLIVDALTQTADIFALHDQLPDARSLEGAHD